jgi:uncharacterized protein YndB with AHSA1/START domain
MSARHFEFVTRWRLDAPVDRVYRALADVADLDEWWPGLRSAEVDGGRDGEAMVEVRGFLPLWFRVRLRVVEAEPNRRLRAEAHGDLEGTATWRLQPTKRGTEATLRWDVMLEHRFLARFARILRPLLIFSHDVAMRRGERGLARYLLASSVLPPARRPSRAPGSARPVG